MAFFLQINVAYVFTYVSFIDLANTIYDFHYQVH